MRSFIACHIPDRRSRVQIGFDQISPSACSTRDPGARLGTCASVKLRCQEPIIWAPDSADNWNPGWPGEENKSATSKSEWDTIYQNLQKSGVQPREVYPNFKKTFLEFSFPFNFPLGISKIFGWMIPILEIHPVFGISGNFSGKILYLLPLFPNVRKFWLNGKCPYTALRRYP